MKYVVVTDIQVLKTNNNGLWSALKRFFSRFYTKLNKVYESVDPDTWQGKYMKDARNKIKSIRDAFLEGAVAAGKNAAINRKASANNAEAKSEKKTVKNQVRAVSKITAEMTDAERYNELKDKKITAPYYNGEVDALIEKNNAALETRISDFAKETILEIADKLGIIGKKFNFNDAEVKIVLSKKT